MVTIAVRFIPAAEQSPVHPPKVDGAIGAAVSVTVVPWLNIALQVPLEQLIPAGLDDTVPVAPPIRVTVTSS